MYPSNKEVVRGGRPPAMGEPGKKMMPQKSMPMMDEPEPPNTPEEPDTDVIPPNPTALGFHTEAETCRHCTYMEGSQCTHPMINQAVNPGDSCHAFEAIGNTEQMGAGDGMEGE